MKISTTSRYVETGSSVDYRLFFASSCLLSFLLIFLSTLAIFCHLKLRRGFVASEVANLDLGQYIFAEILDDPPPRFASSSPPSSSSLPRSRRRGGVYAARVHDPSSYDAIGREILQRCVYPIVPEANVKAKPILVQEFQDPVSSSSAPAASLVGSGGCLRSHVNGAATRRLSVGRSRSLLLDALVANHEKRRRDHTSPDDEQETPSTAAAVAEAWLGGPIPHFGSHRGFLYKEKDEAPAVDRVAASSLAMKDDAAAGRVGGGGAAAVVPVPRTAVLRDGVLLGSRCVLGDKCALIGGCILGDECAVGGGALLHQSTLWKSVTIEEVSCSNRAHKN